MITVIHVTDYLQKWYYPIQLCYVRFIIFFICLLNKYLISAIHFCFFFASISFGTFNFGEFMADKRDDSLLSTVKD